MWRARRQSQRISSSRTLLAAAGVAAAIGGVAACGEPAPAPSDQPTEATEGTQLTDETEIADVLVGPEFTLVDGLPDAPPPGERTWVRFGPEALTASGGCNELHATAWTVDGDRLRIERLSTTDMGCDGPSGQADRALGDLLGAEPAVTLDDARLILTEGDTAAVFERTDALPDDLAGTWSVVGVQEPDESAPAPPGEDVTLELTEGRFALDANCAVFKGELVIDGDQLHYRTRTAGPRPCESGDQSVEALSRFVSDTARWDVDDGTLSITEPDGDTLILARP